ncbi:uncharacterized protein VTP21DRAFT_10698 [Calcarisporiella thermophila]|uniref:uncharacterized protein n=1 Tax=Calcarisporiella thermophila TaxID=911321 RepID=UPI00374316C3
MKDPKYVAHVAANAIISESGSCRISMDALRAVNAFFDQFLFLLLSSTRSLDLNRIKHTALQMLPGTLGKNAIVEAELEAKSYLQNNPSYLSENTENTYEQEIFPLQKAFSLLRERCLYQCTLGDRAGMVDPEAVPPPLDAGVVVTKLHAIYIVTVIENVAAYMLHSMAKIAEINDSEFVRLRDVYAALIGDRELGYLFNRMRLRETLETRLGPVADQTRVAMASSYLANKNKKKIPELEVKHIEATRLSPTHSLEKSYGKDGANLRRSPSLANSTSQSPLPSPSDIISRPSTSSQTSIQSNSGNGGEMDPPARPSRSKRRGFVPSDFDQRSVTSAARVSSERSSPGVVAMSVIDETGDDDDRSDGYPRSVDFDQVIRSGETMKVTLTPNRLRTIDHRNPPPPPPPAHNHRNAGLGEDAGRLKPAKRRLVPREATVKPTEDEDEDEWEYIEGKKPPVRETMAEFLANTKPPGDPAPLSPRQVNSGKRPSVTSLASSKLMLSFPEPPPNPDSLPSANGSESGRFVAREPGNSQPSKSFESKVQRSRSPGDAIPTSPHSGSSIHEVTSPKKDSMDHSERHSNNGGTLQNTDETVDDYVSEDDDDLLDMIGSDGGVRRVSGRRGAGRKRMQARDNEGGDVQSLIEFLRTTEPPSSSSGSSSSSSRANSSSTPGGKGGKGLRFNLFGRRRGSSSSTRSLQNDHKQLPTLPHQKPDAISKSKYVKIETLHGQDAAARKQPNSSIPVPALGIEKLTDGQRSPPLPDIPTQSPISDSATPITASAMPSSPRSPPAQQIHPLHSPHQNGQLNNVLVQPRSGSQNRDLPEPPPQEQEDTFLTVNSRRSEALSEDEGSSTERVASISKAARPQLRQYEPPQRSSSLAPSANSNAGESSNCETLSNQSDVSAQITIGELLNLRKQMLDQLSSGKRASQLLALVDRFLGERIIGTEDSLGGKSGDGTHDLFLSEEEEDMESKEDKLSSDGEEARDIQTIDADEPQHMEEKLEDIVAEHEDGEESEDEGEYGSDHKGMIPVFDVVEEAERMEQESSTVALWLLSCEA